MDKGEWPTNFSKARCKSLNLLINYKASLQYLEIKYLTQFWCFLSQTTFLVPYLDYSNPGRDAHLYISVIGVSQIVNAFRNCLSRSLVKWLSQSLILQFFKNLEPIIGKAWCLVNLIQYHPRHRLPLFCYCPPSIVMHHQRLTVQYAQVQASTSILYSNNVLYGNQIEFHFHY